MSKVRILQVAAGLGLVIAACSSAERPPFYVATSVPAEGGASSGSSGGVAPRTGAPEEFIKSFCGMVGACCTGYGRSTDGSPCRTFVDQGGPFDPLRAQACLDQFSALTKLHPLACATFQSPDCVLGARGTAALGATCTRDTDCAPSEAGIPRCRSVCTLERRGKLGETCTRTFALDGSQSLLNGAVEADGYTMCWEKDGLVCDATTKKCGPVHDLGKPCDPFQLECGSGAWCPQQTGATCSAPLAIGGECVPTAAVPQGHYCDAGGYCDAASKKCKALDAVGAACAQAEGFKCVTGTCNGSGKCATPVEAKDLLLCGSR
jgi:hypothetical protein